MGVGAGARPDPGGPLAQTGLRQRCVRQPRPPRAGRASRDGRRSRAGQDPLSIRAHLQRREHLHHAERQADVQDSPAIVTILGPKALSGPFRTETASPWPAVLPTSCCSGGRTRTLPAVVIDGVVKSTKGRLTSVDSRRDCPAVTCRQVALREVWNQLGTSTTDVGRRPSDHPRLTASTG